ncbi:MAG: ATP-binding cassette domain-containing protein [Epsilonproteobacteria bacterium]|nr:ATP-binding cassette domain-containing protein [Campylobacterota bacterium]
MLRKIILITAFAINSSVDCTQGKFLLLMGPSGAGKSTLINHLKALDDRFVYVTPFTTRDLRPGEQDKIHISMEQLENLRSADKLLTINHMYGIYYATPKYSIDEALAAGRFPVLDWPIEKLTVMQEQYSGQLYKVYVEPDDIEELHRRLSLDSRDKDGKRYQAGKLEIENLLSGSYDALVDLRIVNKKGCDLQTAQDILRSFLQTVETPGSDL